MEVKKLGNRLIEIIFENDKEAKPFLDLLQLEGNVELDSLICNIKEIHIIDYDSILKEIEQDRESDEFYTEEESQKILFGDDNEIT